MIRNVLCRLAENGFTDEALTAATATSATYWDRDLWGYLANIRSRGRCYSFATVPRGRTRLMEAAHSGRADRLKWLLSIKDGSHVGTIDFYGYNAFYYAVEACHLDCVDLLVAAGACISDLAPTIELYDLILKRESAFAIRATEAVMRSTKIDFFKTQELLLNAIKYGQVECVQAILATISSVNDIKGAHLGENNHNVNLKFEPTEYQLQQLSSWPHVLVRKINYDSFQEVKTSISMDPLCKCYPELLQVMFQASARIPSLWQFEKQSYLMRYALMFSDVEAVRFLLDNEPASREYATCAEHRNAVLKEVYNGIDRKKAVMIAKLLLDAGAPVRLPNSPLDNQSLYYGRSVNMQPLHFAISAMSPECVRSLIANGALVPEELVTYFEACTTTKICNVESLPESDAIDVIAQLLESAKLLKYEWTKYHLQHLLCFMCERGFASGVRLLLQWGADGITRLRGNSSMFRLAVRSGDDESAAQIVRMLVSQNIYCDSYDYTWSRLLQDAINLNSVKTIQAIIDSGVLTICYEPMSIILIMLHLHSLVDPINSSIALKIFAVLQKKLQRCGTNTACSLEMLFASSKYPMQTATICEFNRILEATQDKAPKHIMLLRLLINEFGGSFRKDELILTLFKKFRAPNAPIIQMLLELGEIDVRTAKGIEAFVLSCTSDPGAFLKETILPSLTISVRDAITDACFMYICERGFNISLEAILGATGPDAHKHWALLEPIKACLITKTLTEGKLQNVYILLHYDIGTEQSTLISAIKMALKSGQVELIPPLLRALKCRLRDMPRCRYLVYYIYERYMLLEKINVEITELLLHHGLNANKVCNYNEAKRNIIIAASRNCDAATLDVLLCTCTRSLQAGVLHKALLVFLSVYESRFDAIGLIALLKAAGCNLKKALLDHSFNKLQCTEVSRAVIVSFGASDDLKTRDVCRRVFELSRNYYDNSLSEVMRQMGAWRI